MTNDLRTVQHLLEQSSLFAGAIALKAGPRTVTYAELAEKVDLLAARLLTQAGETELIGISTTRGVEMVVGVLAILRAGKGYVPLDPAYPASRLARMIANADLTHCLAPPAETDFFTGLSLQVLAADEAAPSPVALPLAETGPLAYVLYTSGSTGEPKGVAMGHAALNKPGSVAKPGVGGGAGHPHSAVRHAELRRFIS